jgi:hypothetical protein
MAGSCSCNRKWFIKKVFPQNSRLLKCKVDGPVVPMAQKEAILGGCQVFATGSGSYKSCFPQNAGLL